MTVNLAPCYSLAGLVNVGGSKGQHDLSNDLPSSLRVETIHRQFLKYSTCRVGDDSLT